MKAITVLPGRPDQVRVDDLPDPQPASGDLLVQGRLLGICGTDVDIVQHGYGWPPPGRDRLVIGHESLGAVIDAPAGSRRVPMSGFADALHKHGLLVAVGVDLLMDGILVGLSVATLGRAQGVVLTIALTPVVLPLALSVTVELSNRGSGAVQAALIPPLLSLALVVGAIGAVVLLGSAPAAVLAGILAFGVAALLFLVAEELLVEAHETVDTPLLAAMFFVGFFVLYILDVSH